MLHITPIPVAAVALADLAHAHASIANTAVTTVPTVVTPGPGWDDVSQHAGTAGALKGLEAEAVLLDSGVKLIAGSWELLFDAYEYSMVDLNLGSLF